MDTITECFETILKGGKEESRRAARRVRKLVYSSSASDRGIYEQIAALVEVAPEKYARILEDWRQENFVIAISVIYFLHSKDNQPDFLFPWLFQLLEHPNGYIRHAAVKMISQEIWPLTYHIRFPGEKSSFYKLLPEQADNILYSLFVSLNRLLSAVWQPKYKKYKYISSLPPSPYKSAQMVLAELEESCGEGYMDRFTAGGISRSNIEIESKEQILKRRKEIEKELLEMLKATKSDFELNDIKEIIYNEDGQDDLAKIIAMFDTGQYAPEELQDLLELVNNAWNYFPHKIIGGFSPAEKVLEFQKKYGEKF
ncbi:MAG: hypothetical protein WBD99_13100 [Thermodesulfobacteriota bacterium]